jgi:tRNA A37 threonylcarbamoyladenosine biosynthesis protein TsaE
VAEELQESLVDPFAVTVIEWATTVQDVLPKQRIIIEIMKTADNENQRSLTISIPSGLDYLAQGISI